MTRTLTIALTLLFAPGCALLSKSEPLEVRYFTPEAVAHDEPSSGHTAESGMRLKLGKVEAASHLDQRIVYREQGHEVGYYTGLRWTESPEEYVRRGLDEVLFEQLGLTRVMSGPAPTLEVELLSFEEVKAPRHVGRVVLSVALVDDRYERYRRTFVVEKPIDGDDPSSTVRALSSALETGLDQIAHETQGQLHLAKVERERSASPTADARAD